MTQETDSISPPSQGQTPSQGLNQGPSANGETFFAADYRAARQAFTNAAHGAGAAMHTYPHALQGLHAEDLAIDVAWLGPRNARQVLVSLSATHGVEGFYGSACQAGFLQVQPNPLPPDTAVLLIHALNPYGFSWLRRVNEDNIDLNRNFVDFAQPLASNPGYAQAHAMLLPDAWTPESAAQLRADVQALMQRMGAVPASFALTGGQYTHADGIFYGGQSLAWSNRTLAAIAQAYLQDAKAICVLDHHTGLGPPGHTEIICRHAPNSAALSLARLWFGADVTSPAAGESTSTVIDGNVRMALVGLCPQALVVAVCLEVGTLPKAQVIEALIASNWLHARGNPRSSQAGAIRQQLRDAFYVDTDAWRQQCFTRAMQIYQQSLKGLLDLQLTAHAANI